MSNRPAYSPLELRQRHEKIYSLFTRFDDEPAGSVIAGFRKYLKQDDLSWAEFANSLDAAWLLAQHTAQQQAIRETLLAIATDPDASQQKLRGLLGERKISTLLDDSHYADALGLPRPPRLNDNDKALMNRKRAKGKMVAETSMFDGVYRLRQGAEHASLGTVADGIEQKTGVKLPDGLKAAAGKIHFGKIIGGIEKATGLALPGSPQNIKKKPDTPKP